jgi:hypothetical protein
MKKAGICNISNYDLEFFYAKKVIRINKIKSIGGIQR